MRAPGYALAELLVAVAIAGLIVTSLMFLNVDYVGFARRVVDIQGPFAIGLAAPKRPAISTAAPTPAPR